jgi:hypothetical protein
MLMEEEEFPELFSHDLANLPPLPKYKYDHAPCLACRRDFRCEFKKTARGWKRIIFICQICRRKKGDVGI